MDSNLIAACEHFHYGFSAIRADFLVQVPRFIDPNKPNYGSGDFLGRVAGVSADVVGNTEPAFTMVSDSFGAFGWMGVCLTALVLVPLVFRIYESMFNMGQPWGTVALLLCITGTGEGGLGQVLAVALIRIPVYLVVISYVVGMLTRLVPASGDRALEPLRVPQRSGLKITTDGSTS